MMSSTTVNQQDSNNAASKEPVFSSFIQEYCLISEYNMVAKYKEPGVYVIPAANTPFQWFGVIFVKSGPYEGGIFRWILKIPHTFPECHNNELPTVVFETSVYHPLVHQHTGLLALNNILFNEWRKDVDRLWQLVDYTKRIFYNVTTKNALNKEAAYLYENDRETFLYKVSECVKDSKISIYKTHDDGDNDGHYLRFDEYDESVHNSTRLLLFSQPDTNHQEMKSASWVQPGSIQALSRQVDHTD